jgi:hypothetical protein
MRKVATVGAIAAVWALAAAAALWIAAETAVGPVVFVVSRSEAHGVHLGDLAGVAVCAAWALHATVVVLRWGRRPPR